MVKPKIVGIRIDIETRSRTDIKHGAYRYTEDPDFKVLIIAYTPIREYVGGARKLGRVRVLDESDYNEVSQFRKMLVHPDMERHAYNANFERIALSRWYGLPTGTYFDPKNWRCSAILSNVNGVFGTLDEVAQAVRSPIKKDTEGKRLIRLFSIPDKKSGLFHEPQGECWCGVGDPWKIGSVGHEMDFRKYRDYCKQDVVTEAVVARAFPRIPDHNQREYEMDQRINDRGIRHFAGLSRAAVEQVELARSTMMAQLQTMTGLDNPNSIPQFKGWLEAQGYPVVSLDKAHREQALTDSLCPPHVADAIRLKGQASLSSVAKHKAALDTRSHDGRIRGSLRYYGAHTGREAGRGIQPQNLPRYEAPYAERIALLQRTIPWIDAPLAAKGTVRASLVPAKGHVFVTCDYNAIEARVLAGLAGEKWAEAEFAGDGKIYEATAQAVLGASKAQLIADLKACDKCGKCVACAIRARAKVANLALGYGGGAGALVTMGAEDAGLDIGNYASLHAVWVADGRPGKFHEWKPELHDYPELQALKNAYRDASPATVRFWKLCAKAFDLASAGKGARFGQGQTLAMIRDGRHNRLVMPSGRSIWYRFARSYADPNNPERIDYRTFIGKAAGRGQVKTETHGGKLTENVTQAVARDILFDLLERIEDKTAGGWPARTVLHVHDEVVLEVPVKHADQVLADTIGLMSETPKWGSIFVVKGEGKIMSRYGK